MELWPLGEKMSYLRVYGRFFYIHMLGVFVDDAEAFVARYQNCFSLYFVLRVVLPL